ncbi:MAG TPA: PAS domain S-box protein, partial [Phototrophicaceae bacterium]|nr:PAS domain S-box protein [Phototrophicaceae bacterium]
PAADQFVVIFTDITERKRTEAQIHKLNRMLRVLNEVNQALVRADDEAALIQQVCQIIVDVGGYRLVWVGWAETDAAKTIRPVAAAGDDAGYLAAMHLTWADTERGRGPTGTAIRTGHTSVFNDAQNHPDFAPWQEAARQNGYAATIALPLRIKGLALGALNIYAGEPNAFDEAEIRLLTEMADDLAYGIVSLRTQAEHQQAEKALQTSEQKYRHLFENLTAGFALHEMLYDDQGKPLDYRYLEVNPAFEKLTGLAAAALVGKTVKTVMPNIEPYWIETYGRVAQTGKPIAYENYARELGKHYDVWAFSPAQDQFAVVFTDVTERKQAEAHIHKLNRMLRVLNDVNQMLVRAEDEMELIRHVCQTLVDGGGYRLAWVGWAETDAAKTIRPVAYAGYNAGYLEALNLTWADTERGRGPSGTAIRRNRPVVFNDLQLHPDFALWREAALQGGYGSVISLPLLSKGLMLGILSIYASEPNAFDETEIKLLTEMADDLAYGVVSLRTQREHQRIEAALEESEARYRSIFDVSPDGIMLHQLDSRLLLTNRQGALLFGYDQPEELLALDEYAFDAIIPAEHARLRENLDQLLTEGQVKNARFTIIRRDQSPLPVEINAALVRGTDGQPLAFTTVTRDITEQLQAESDITAWQMRYELVAIASNQVVYECDLREGSIIWGGSLEQVLGYQLDEMTGRLDQWEDLIEPADREETLLMLHNAGENVADFQAEYGFKHKNGHYIRILDRGFFLPTPTGTVQHLIGVMQDITERQQAEQQHLELALERERSATFRELVGTIAHDLKTPLAAINTSLYLFGKHTDPDKRQEKLDNIQTQTHILSDFIQDLMTIVRLDGEPEFVLTLMDLNELIATLEPDFLSQVEEKQLTLTLMLERNLPLVSIDASIWRRVLTNLIENAINYTPAEHSVTVQTSRQDQSVVFTVEDTGIGISETDLSHIFDRFYRSDQARALVEGGSGLGLAIVKRVVEMHGGQIKVESQVGVGSCFRVFLPIAP